MKMIKYHWQLDVYKLAVDAAMEIFELTKAFPRSSRSVSVQIAEGWRRRKYEGVFVNKLNESEGEAAETQGWLEYAVKCSYLDRNTGRQIHRTYDRILGMLVTMGNNPKRWILTKSTDR